MARSEDVKTSEAIVSFAHNLFELQERENGKKMYGCSLIFPVAFGAAIAGSRPPTKAGEPWKLITLQEVALEAAIADWGDKAIQWIKDGVIHSPFLDGSGKQAVSKKTGERHPGFAGKTFIRAISGADYRPKVVNSKREPINDKAELPSGSRVTAVLNAFTWENKEKGKGISFSVNLVQRVKLATGDEVLGGGGGPDPDKWLDKIDDEGDAPASTKGGQGAAGLFG